MYQHYDFTQQKGIVAVERDGWTCYRNRRDGVRIVPTVKSILGYYRRALVDAIVPRWSLH